MNASTETTSGIWGQDGYWTEIVEEATAGSIRAGLLISLTGTADEDFGTVDGVWDSRTPGEIHVQFHGEAESVAVPIGAPVHVAYQVWNDC